MLETAGRTTDLKLGIQLQPGAQTETYARDASVGLEPVSAKRDFKSDTGHDPPSFLSLYGANHLSTCFLFMIYAGSGCEN